MGAYSNQLYRLLLAGWLGATATVLRGANDQLPMRRDDSTANRATVAGVVARSTATPPGRHWAFQKPVRSKLPRNVASDRVRTPIDLFLLERLQDKRLTFAADVARATLLQRAYLDLIGLPPTPREIDAFLTDDRVDAYDRVLDRLLDSPQFGERWGRHWLDVVGYTDTVGFDIDAALIIQSEGKWRYRDYVIRSLNEDKPYDRFITEQLAGDELVDWRNATTFTPEIRELLVATGYLRTAQDYTHEPESDIPLNHFAVLHDTIEIVGSSLLGLTLNCARCHDHKFDPVPQLDYYRLMAVFTPAYNPNDWRAVTPYKPGIIDRSLPDVSPSERAAIDRHNGAIDNRVADFNKQLSELRRPYEQRLFDTKLGMVPEPIRADTRAAIETPGDKRNEIQQYLASKFESALKVSTDEVVATLEPADKVAHAQIIEQIAALNRRRRAYGKIQALFDVGPAPATHLLVRGNHETPGVEVEPGFLSAIDDGGAEFGGSSTASTSSSGRRAAFAHWLTRPDSAAAGLMARVTVNRIWQHLFGQGLVPTPENFGCGGERPTNPELLDWLAVEFIENGWRVKPLIKLIMTSTAYRQSSRPWSNATAGTSPSGSFNATDPEQVDPGNTLLWRQRLRRLEAETIRDRVLATSGQIDLEMGGPPILLESRPDGMVIIAQKSLPSSSSQWRRSVYLLARHQYHLSMLTSFDQPVLATNCVQRMASAVPLQSLTMLNDAMMSEQSEHFATRVIGEAGNEPMRQIEWAFRIALGRLPSFDELGAAQDMLARQTSLLVAEQNAHSEAARRALVHLCQTLLNTSEFLYAP